MNRLPLRLVLLSALLAATVGAWATSTTTKREIQIRSSHPSIAQSDVTESSVDLYMRGGGGGGGGGKEVGQVPPFHWAQVWAIAFNVAGLYFPIKGGASIVLRLMKEGALTTKQRYIGSAILVLVNLPSASRFAFSIAPKMVNRTINRVGPKSTWHRKLLAPFATIGLLPFTRKALKMTAIITPSVCLYVYLTGLIPQPYQDIYKSGVYYLNLAPMALGMIVGMIQHYLKSTSSIKK